MSYEVATDKIHRVQNEDGATIDVRPWPDAPTSVAIMNSGQNSKEYFGDMSEFAMSTEFARAIGYALIGCANEIDGEIGDYDGVKMLYGAPLRDWVMLLQEHNVTRIEDLKGRLEG